MLTTRYVVKKFNLVRNCWSYYNSYNSYTEAAEARDNLIRRFGKGFEIFEETIEE